MRIGYVWDSEYPWDVRTEKLAQAMTGLGHHVHLMARNRRQEPIREQLAEAVVHRLPSLAALPGFLRSAASFPAFMNPLWLQLLRGTIRRERLEAVICRDLPLAPAVLSVCRHCRIPAILDMAENYPAMMQERWDLGLQSAADWLLRNPRIVAAVERWSLPRFAHVLVVVEESGQRIEGLGVPRERITVVGNTPALSMLALAQEARGPRSGVLRLAYLGLLEGPRGIASVIEAIGVATAEGLSVELDIYGDGKESGTFRQLAAERGLDRCVRFHGRVSRESGLQGLAQADVGVIPHLATEAWNTTIPNKLFDYMALGLAVLSSDAIPAARVVRETGAGVVHRAGDPTSIVEALRELSRQGVRERLGLAGRKAIAAQYHWERDVDRLEVVLRQVVQS